MYKSPRAAQVTGKMLHLQGVWKVYFNELHNFLFFNSNSSFHLSDLYPVSLHNFFYIIYNPVIVIGINYFVLWNDFMLQYNFC